MDMIYWAIIALGAFVAIWLLFVAPAERRHHERKLDLLKKRIDGRQSPKNQETGESTGEQDGDAKESR